MAGFTTQINTFNKNKFKILLSNFPNLTKYKWDIHIFNNYLKSFQIPDLSIPMLTSVFGHDRQLHPSPIGSRDLQTITVEFQIDEEFKNFNAAYQWLFQMRNGMLSDRTDLQKSALLRLDSIDEIQIITYNNNKEPVSKFSFIQCILNNISSLPLDYSQAEIGTFTCTFEYEKINFELLNEKEK